MLEPGAESKLTVSAPAGGVAVATRVGVGVADDDEPELAKVKLSKLESQPLELPMVRDEQVPVQLVVIVASWWTAREVVTVG